MPTVIGFLWPWAINTVFPFFFLHPHPPPPRPPHLPLADLKATRRWLPLIYIFIALDSNLASD